MGLRNDFNSFIATQLTRPQLTEVIDKAADYLNPVLREIEGIEADRSQIPEVSDAKRFPRVSRVNWFTRSGSEVAKVLPRSVRTRIHDRLSDAYKRLDDEGRELFAELGIPWESDLARLCRMILSSLQTLGQSALDRDEKRELLDRAYAQRGAERKIMNKAASKTVALNDRIERLWQELQDSEEAPEQIVIDPVLGFQVCRKVH